MHILSGAYIYAPLLQGFCLCLDFVISEFIFLHRPTFSELYIRAYRHSTMIESQQQQEPELFPELVQTPLAENMIVPPVFTGLSRELDKLAEQPLLGPKATFPSRKYLEDINVYARMLIIVSSFIHIRPQRCLWKPTTTSYRASRL